MSTSGSEEHGPLPDFIIGGAPRSGTTWLYRALERHPSVWLAKPVRPEPKFFLVDEEYDRGLSYYSHRWFADAPDGAVLGEKSTNYLENAGASNRINHDLPGAKLLFLIREPAGRAWSGYRFSKMNGLEHLAFDEALERETEREEEYDGPLCYSRPFSYFARGLYARNLEPWLRQFSSGQIFVGRYEDLISDPASLITAVHSFLGVDPRPYDVNGLGVVNASDNGDADPTVISMLRKRYLEPNEQLFELVGSRLWGDQ